MHNLYTVYTAPSKDQNRKEKSAKVDTNHLAFECIKTLCQELMGLCFSGCFVLQVLTETQLKMHKN